MEICPTPKQVHFTNTLNHQPPGGPLAGGKMGKEEQTLTMD